MTPEEATKLGPQDRVTFDPDGLWIDSREIEGHSPQPGDVGMVLSSTVSLQTQTLKCTLTVMWDKMGPADIQRTKIRGAMYHVVKGPPKQLQSTLPCQYLKRAKNKPSVEFKRNLTALRQKKALPLDSTSRQIIQPRVLPASSFIDGTTSGRYSPDKSPLTVESIEQLMKEMKKNGSL